MKPEKYDVVILGGGAAGLMCAFIAGKRSKRVLVLEVSNKIGKKILMSGGGRCNFTNLEITADNFLSQNPHFCKSALKQYSHWDFISMVATHGIEYEERKHQQLFCVGSSKEILTMLKAECDDAKVTIWNKADTQSIEFKNGLSQLFVIHDGIEKSVIAESLVIATGGLSIPTLGGATGFAYQLAHQLKLNVLERSAGLVPFTLSGRLLEFSNALAGVSLPVNVAVTIEATKGVESKNSKRQQNFYEDMLFTHRGISGPSILQISSYWQLGCEVEIDLLPTMHQDKLLNEFLITKQNKPNGMLKNLLNTYFPKALAVELAKLFGKDKADTPLQGWQKADLYELCQQLKAWCFKPSGTEGYRTAEVTLGGVDTQHISSQTMQVKGTEEVGVASVFIIGEALDVTGHLGGYNFQWAWSSGYVAGINV